MSKMQKCLTGFLWAVLAVLTAGGPFRRKSNAAAAVPRRIAGAGARPLEI